MPKNTLQQRQKVIVTLLIVVIVLSTEISDSSAAGAAPCPGTRKGGGGSTMTMATTTTTTTPSHKLPESPNTGHDRNEIELPSFGAPFGSYPNLLDITEKERECFSPVVFFPKGIAGEDSSHHPSDSSDVPVKDHRNSSGELASPSEIERWKAQKKQLRFQGIVFRKLLGMPRITSDTRSDSECWGLGKYDENRDGGMYESDLFDDLENTIDGYGGRRTVHLGMDLGGPVGTPVYAFCDGIVHSVGYNPELGDYGYVMVVKHFWGDETTNDHQNETGRNDKANNTIRHPKRCWALYGHLDESVLTSTGGGDSNVDGVNDGCWKFLPKRRPPSSIIVKPGDFVRKGQILGRMGDIDENGGWIHSHLHFQLSTKPPDQPHDMPGASSVKDRRQALLQYVDPRYVVGPLY